MKKLLFFIALTLCMGVAMAQQPAKTTQACQHHCGSCTHHQCQTQQAQPVQQNVQAQQHQCSGHQQVNQQNTQSQVQQHQCDAQHEGCNHQCQDQSKGKPRGTKHVKGKAPKPQGDRKELKPQESNK